MKTKIIATLGPATNNQEVISSLVREGMNIARLNFSWGTHENMDELIGYVRTACDGDGGEVFILQDLSGPRLVMEHGHKINDQIENVITEKDRHDLSFGLSRAVDYVALSYVSAASDIHELKELMLKDGYLTKIIAKIERQEALDNLSEIIDASDGIMIARGDLGLALPLEQLPFLERDIIAKCKEKNKFVIVATEMMLSMTEALSPTRAEVNDVATAVLLGADAVMLSEESARGKHPVETVTMMKKIITYAEEQRA
jgi:pyruvate kinase